MKKLRCKKGITLTEMLCVLLVLTLIGVTLVTGVQFAVEAFTQSVARSEAKILCSTLSAAIKDELRYAGSVSGTGGNFTYFSNSSSGGGSYFTDTDGIVKIVNGENTVRDLVSKSAYTYGAKAALTVTYNNTTNTFTVKLDIYNKGKLQETSHFEVERLKENP